MLLDKSSRFFSLASFDALCTIVITYALISELLVVYAIVTSIGETFKSTEMKEAAGLIVAVNWEVSNVYLLKQSLFTLSESTFTVFSESPTL